ncbi:MAG TPA: metalloregulator ArsR/SmtB family transcription factor [Rhizomicrobium sp.]|jgi:DNA-binding transcriptional ArsR family regulator
MAAPNIDLFYALSNPARRQILTTLRKGPKPVTALADGFAIGRPAISEHLQILRRVGLVREEPRGRERYYHLDPRPFDEIHAWLEAFTPYWKARMKSLETLLDEEKNNERR